MTVVKQTSVIIQFNGCVTLRSSFNQSQRLQIAFCLLCWVQKFDKTCLNNNFVKLRCLDLKLSCCKGSFKWTTNVLRYDLWITAGKAEAILVLSVYSLTGYNVAIMQCALGLGAALNQEDIELGNNQWMKFNAEKTAKQQNWKLCAWIYLLWKFKLYFD